MKNSSPLFVANWKMNKSFDEEVAFCTDHLDDLVELSIQTKSYIVLCPTFPSLHAVAQHCTNTPLKVGAQACSPHAAGAYTGQVSAQSLREVGCTYIIVGHSEQREYCNVTNQNIASAAQHAIHEGLVPIICVGETAKQKKAGHTLKTLEKELAPIMHTIDTTAPFCIAYEPIWSIGTGDVPDVVELGTIFSWIKNHVSRSTCTLLYGGSVNEKTAPIIYEVPDVEGFLIGGASLDFQKLKNIVLLSK